MAKKEQQQQPQDAEQQDKEPEQQKDVIETVGKGTFTLPDGTVKENY